MGARAVARRLLSAGQKRVPTSPVDCFGVGPFLKDVPCVSRIQAHGEVGPFRSPPRAHGANGDELVS